MLIFRKQLSRNKTKHWNFKVMIGVSIWICRALDQTTWHAIYLFIATLRALYLSKFQGFATWPSPCCWFWFHLCSSDCQSVKWKVGHRKASHLADDLMSLVDHYSPIWISLCCDLRIWLSIASFGIVNDWDTLKGIHIDFQMKFGPHNPILLPSCLDSVLLILWLMA